VCAGLLVGLVLAAAGPARAEGPMPLEADRRETARTMFAQGLEYADAGRWHEAADRFRRAYQAKPTAEIAYNLASAYTRLGYLAGAAELLQRAADDGEASAAVRSAAQARLAQVTPRLGRLTVRLTPATGAFAYLDGRPLEPARLGVTLPVDPGPHLVQARWRDGADLSRRVTIAEGGASTVDLVPPVPAVAEAPPARGTPLYRRGWFWAAMAGVAAGTALAFTLPHLGGDQVSGNVGTWHVGNP
jgi:hypothetical protein